MHCFFRFQECISSCAELGMQLVPVLLKSCFISLIRNLYAQTIDTVKKYTHNVLEFLLLALDHFPGKVSLAKAIGVIFSPKEQAFHQNFEVYPRPPPQVSLKLQPYINQTIITSATSSLRIGILESLIELNGIEKVQQAISKLW